MAKGIELSISTVVILVILLITMFAVLIFFKGGFSEIGGKIADVVTTASEDVTTEEIIPEGLTNGSFFGFGEDSGD